ncbi:Acid sphingomyelinase-like phosphodiesterase 3b [Portunus trituberculatus]|uniref:Acid sphingomyelinase-like phosphodiesterase 3b n=1 Tax=Portunus trituberculatus TaxID=210409 RepID=A0A5B7JG32_PORTR|nr:Acid sphingomyelinase-like phosphodiesterase 3b [Portunus trituberculatus]
MCHRAYQSGGHNSKWGNYNCDSPWPLVKSAIQAMVDIEARPDFVLWTGDNAPHTDDPEPNFSVIFSSLSNITGELRTAFHPSIPVLPVLGNHDAFPKNDYPVAGKEFYGKYLTEGGWAALLPAEAQQEFVNGGYYSYTLDSGVMVRGGGDLSDF